MGKFFLKCEEASHVCDKSQYQESSFIERIKLTFHLVYCKVCRGYSRNNSKLTSCIEKSKVTCLDESVKKEIKEHFQKELVKY